VQIAWKKEADLARMYLLPWALLEEIIRSQDLSRLDHLEKILLSFHVFLHYLDLSFLPRVDGVTQRFDKRRTAVVTFRHVATMNKTESTTDMSQQQTKPNKQ
jgi:hypothetical protein